MMTFFKNLFFPRLPKPVSNDVLEANRAKRIRNIVATISTGNMSLQRGAFMLDADVEQLRRKNEGAGLGK